MPIVLGDIPSFYTLAMTQLGERLYNDEPVWGRRRLREPQNPRHQQQPVGGPRAVIVIAAVRNRR